MAERSASPLDTGLRLLARREHSVRELRTKLASRGFEPDVIDRTLNELVERDLLSDERFAAAFVRSRLERGQGPLKIRSQLKQRGVSGALTESVLIRADVDWDRCASSARLRRFGEQAPGDRSELARQARFLRSRGFSEGQVARALLSEFSR